MKKLIPALIFILLSLTLLAQVPNKMSFQAVVRDNANNLITNARVGVRISILKNSETVYSEIQYPTTNSNGLITLEFGGGEGFSAIDWANGPYFLKNEIDTNGGQNYNISGTSQILSVPYALHAQTASYLTGEAALKLKAADVGPSAQVWSKAGNAKTDPLVDKLGTTDLTDMVFVTNNAERMRLKSDGMLDLNNSVSVKNNVFLNTAAGGTTNSGTLTVGGITNLNNALNVNNQYPTYLSGDLDVGGVTSFQGATTFSGKTTMTGADFSGQVTINANLNGGESSYGAYPLRIQGSDQGIAIKVNGSRANKNNFVTFWDENGVQGRIEGETVTEMETNPQTIFDNSIFATDAILGGLDVGIAGWEFGQAIADLAAACSSTTGCAGLGAVVCAPIPSLIVAATTNLVLKTATLAVEIGNEVKTVAEGVGYNAFKIAQIGVTYQSGAGDYAEYLPKFDPATNFTAGDVVGVKFGKISANTSDVDRVMVVSSKPIVLGNTPEAGKENDYEKIAFMGQVPVKVLGSVIEGDYILPSGQNDGYGIAKRPADMTVEDYSQIVGIAWPTFTLPAGYVNVAVGLNANDVARYTIKLEQKIEDLTTRIEAIELAIANGSGTGNGNSGSNERKIKYYKPSKDQIEEGIEMAKAKLIEDGVNVDNHPFFKKLKEEPGYKEEFLDKVDKAFDKEVEEKTKYNEKHGIKTEKE